MELSVSSLGQAHGQDSIQTALRDTLSKIYLGNVIDIWQDQRQTCVGSHAEFAKHLLAVHKEYCLDYCCAKSQEEAAVLSLCADSYQDKNHEPFQSMRLSDGDGKGKASGFAQHVAKHVPENLHNEKERHDNSIEDPDWVDDESDHDTLQEEEMDQTMDATQETVGVDAKLCVCTDCGETFSEMKSLESHMKSHKAENINVSNGDDLIFSRLGNLNDHRNPYTIAMSPVDKDYHATIKDKMHESTRGLHSKSTKTLHSGRDTNSEQAKSSFAKLMINMMKPTKGKPHVCSDCRKAFKHLSSLKRHMAMNHIDDTLHVCPDCGKDFLQVHDLKVHMMTHMGEKPHSCSECGRVFSHFSSLKAHMSTHEVAKLHVCFDCGKGFNELSTLKAHMKTNMGKKPNVCSDCGKECSTSGSLKTHMMTHTGEKPHTCHECGMHFRHVGSLKIHMMDHRGEKPHVCSHCGRGFTVLSRLKAHVMTHTGEKPHLCSVCRKGFSHTSQLKTHMRSHTGEKPHVCIECGRAFSVLASLKTHKTTHTGERPHVCEQCGARFSAMGNLKKHMMTHGGETTCFSGVWKGF